MHEQTRINDRDEIESQPLTWDGEPVYSPSTVREGLFDPEAFEQMREQMAISDPYCETCGKLIRGSFRPCCAEAADLLAQEDGNV